MEDSTCPPSLFYHGFGITGYDYCSTAYREGNRTFTISRKKFNLCCPVCKSKEIIKHGSLPRWFHSLPIGKKAIYMKTEIPRVEYKECKTNRQAEVDFAHPRFTYAKAFSRYVPDFARHMTIADVSKHLNLNWDIINCSYVLHNLCRLSSTRGFFLILLYSPSFFRYDSPCQ